MDTTIIADHITTRLCRDQHRGVYQVRDNRTTRDVLGTAIEQRATAYPITPPPTPTRSRATLNDGCQIPKKVEQLVGAHERPLMPTLVITYSQRVTTWTVAFEAHGVRVIRVKATFAGLLLVIEPDTVIITSSRVLPVAVRGLIWGHLVIDRPETQAIRDLSAIFIHRVVYELS